MATKAERINAMIGFLCLLLTLFTYWLSKKMY
ncbi:LrgB family protein, partial [Bacillus thuringiensis]|nr:LrgB family protein [Bacillus thuringiensis]